METKQIEIKKATIIQLAKYPAENDPTSVLTLHAPLPLALAKLLKCDELCFTLNENPRKFDGKIGLPLELGENESEVVLPNFMGAVDSIRPLKVWKFRVGHDKHDALGIDLRIHFKGEMECVRVDEFFGATNSDEFTFAIKSTQGELFAEKPEGDGEGTRVDMSNGEVQEEDEDEEGENDSDEDNGSSSLPSMREMAGGTTAALKKQRGRRKVQPISAPEAEVEAEVLQTA